MNAESLASIQGSVALPEIPQYISAELRWVVGTPLIVLGDEGRRLYFRGHDSAAAQPH